MRIIRVEFEEQYDRPYHAGEYEPIRTGDSAVEARIWFNRFETKLILAVLWVRHQWAERITWRLGRLNCRLFRRHNVSCRGRRDHTILGVGIVDPERWHFRPRG